MKYCSECKNEKTESYCYFCKKDTSSNYVMKLPTVSYKSRLNVISMIHKRPGIKRFLKKVTAGFKSSVDTIKHPDGITTSRVIDRENNKYEETITDNVTSKVIRDVSEPLDNHISNRQKRDN